MSNPRTQQQRAHEALEMALRLSKVITLLQAGATTAEAHWRYVAANTNVQATFNNIQLGSEQEVHGDTGDQAKEHGA